MIRIKCIIFDFGNVLAKFDYTITCRKLMNYSPFSAKEIYQRIFRSGLEEKYDRGKIKFKMFHKKVVKAIEAEKLTNRKFLTILGDIFSPNPKMGKLLSALNPQIKLFVLSNTNDVHWRYIMRLPVMEKILSK